MFRTLLLSIAVAVGFSSLANAQERLPPPVQLGVANFVDELIDCSVYFLIAAHGLESRHDGAQPSSQSSTKAYRKSADRLLQHAFVAGKLVGIMPAALQAKMELQSESQRNAIGGSMANISILIAKFHKPCLAINQNPDHRMNALVDKATRDSLRAK